MSKKENRKKGFIRPSLTPKACLPARRVFGVGGQAAIEMTAAIIAIFVFLLGTLQIFIWFNSALVQRQRYYQSSRRQAGTVFSAGGYSFSPPTLNIFGSGGE